MKVNAFTFSLLVGAAACGKPAVPHPEPDTGATSTDVQAEAVGDGALSVGADTAMLMDATKTTEPTEPASEPARGEPSVFVEQFADLRILRFEVPGFERLPLRTKRLIYHLSEATLAGRDIAWDQRHPQGLLVRRTLEAIERTYGDRDTPEFDKFLVYLKRVWFSNGIYHHNSNRKIVPEFTPERFSAWVRGSDPAALPLLAGENPDALAKRLIPLLFDPKIDPVAVSLDADKDLVAHSANNYYARGITQKEVEKFYAERKRPEDPRPVSWGLNSKLIKKGNDLEEVVWKVGGMYGPALEHVVAHLEKAVELAENDAQKAWLLELVAYYRTGDLTRFDAFNVAWVRDTSATVDAIHGFIETYNDALDMRGAFEGLVQVKDAQASKRIATISKEAQWFEDHSPIRDAHKKPNVTGISARVVDVVVGAGDSGPPFPIGVNLPNSDWIRREVGSKSVTLGNIMQAYEQDGRAAGVVREFAPDDDTRARIEALGDLAKRLAVDLHEVIGHASGQLEAGVAPMTDTMKSYASTLEETRADLVALYFILDPKLVELGLMPSLDVGRAAYDEYVMTALTIQLGRLRPGENLEAAHMRNRHLIARWLFERGGPEVIAKLTTIRGTAYRVQDHQRMRALVGELLREVQRIKSSGDYEAGRALVESFGVKVDEAVAEEVRERWAKLGMAPFRGFINPRLVPVVEHGEVVDVRLEYPAGFAEQMREYAAHYAFLPTSN